MTADQFRETLHQPEPPGGISRALQAMWYDAKGSWEAAHGMVQDAVAGELAWVHAYLHRKEGDLSNADYWYHRAGRSRSDSSLQQEASGIIDTLLEQRSDGR